MEKELYAKLIEAITLMQSQITIMTELKQEVTDVKRRMLIMEGKFNQEFVKYISSGKGAKLEEVTGKKIKGTEKDAAPQEDKKEELFNFTDEKNNPVLVESKEVREVNCKVFGVVSKSGKVQKDTIIKIYDKDNKMIKTAKTGNNGSWQVYLPVGKYSLEINYAGGIKEGKAIEVKKGHPALEVL